MFFANVLCASLLTSDVMGLAKVSPLFNMFQYHKFKDV